MRNLLVTLLLFASSLPAVAQHVVEHGGYKILSFEAPRVEYKSSKSGKFTTHHYLGKIGEGNLRITIKSKGWMSSLDAEKRYSADKIEKREESGVRLTNLKEVEGALKTLTYTTTEPYRGKGVTVYTPHFRADILVTGTGEAEDEIDSTYREVLDTLKVLPRTKIGDIEVEE